jgi:predicted amidohydrolase YtcJ
LGLWDKEQLEEVLRRTWERGLEVAVHAIGDAAVASMVELLESLKENGHTGDLHLEHVELASAATVEAMKGHRLSCHLQPAHWLSDHVWLKEKVGDLAALAFPWRRLQ